MPLKVLGQGSFGVVIKLEDRVNGVHALKIIPQRDGGKINEDYINEAEIGQKVSKVGHKNVLKYLNCRKNNVQDYKDYQKLIKETLGLYKCPENFYLIRTEYCNGGSLQEWLTSSQNLLRDKEMSEYLFSQILEGVLFLATNSIVHGDLKPQNILLHHTNDQVQVKICDFGESFDTTKGPHKPHVGTPLYQEKKYEFYKNKLSTSYDIYSLGLIYAIMFMSGSFKLDQGLTSRDTALRNLLESIKALGTFKWIAETHPKRAALIRKMLNDEREERPTAYEVHCKFSKLMKQIRGRYSKSCALPGQNPVFYGRSTHLEQLNNPSQAFKLLHGIPGTGLKSIAAEFLHLKAESPNEFQKFIWFRADSRKTLEAKYQQFKAELKHSNLKIDSVKSWLQTFPKLAIVYENVSDFKDIKDLIPSTTCNGLVICTSRTNSSDWPETFEKIKVGPLQPEECKQLILDSLLFLTNDRPSDLDAANLSEQMAFLPTAICQSLSFIKSEYNIKINTIPKFLEFHQDNLKKLDQKEFEKTFKSELNPIYTTMISTLGHLKGVSKTAFEWVKICAYLDNDNIPEFLFNEFYRQNKRNKSKNEILHVLNSFSILDKVTTTDDINAVNPTTTTYYFRVSRVVQEVLRISCNSSFETTVETIDKLFKEITPNLANNEFKKQGSFLKTGILTPHFESVINHIENYENVSQPKESLVSSCLTSCVSSTSTFEKRFLKLKFKLMVRLRVFYKSLMYREKEKASLQKILQYKEALYGDNNFIMGTTLMAQGKHDLSSAKPLRYQNDSTETFTRLVQSSISHLDQASLLLKKCFEHNERFEVYQCYLLLGDCYLTRIIGSCKERLSPRAHEEPQQWKNNHENATMALVYFEKALEILLHALKQSHMQVYQRIAKTLHKMSSIHQRLEDYKLTENFLILGFEFYLLEGNNTTDTNNKYERAMHLLKQLENIQDYHITEEEFGTTLSKWEDNPQGVCGILKALSDHYKKINPERARLAEEIRIKCKTSEKAYGRYYFQKDGTFQPINPKMGADASVLDTILKRLEKDPKVNQNEIAEKKKFLGECLKSKFKYAEAIQAYEEALEILLNLCKHDDLSIGFLYEKIGECYSVSGDVAKASEMFKLAYNIQKSNSVIKKENNIQFAELISKYAKLLPMDELDMKIELLKESLPIYKTYFVPDHNEVGFVSEKLGSLLIKKGHFVEAKKYLEASQSIFVQRLRAGNQNRISCFKKLLWVNERLCYGSEVARLTLQIQEEEKLNLEYGKSKPDTRKILRKKLIQSTRVRNQQEHSS